MIATYKAKYYLVDGTERTYDKSYTVKKRPIPQEIIDGVKKMLSNGASKKMIKEKYNISYYIINKIIKENQTE